MTPQHQAVACPVGQGGPLGAVIVGEIQQNVAERVCDDKLFAVVVEQARILAHHGKVGSVGCFKGGPVGDQEKMFSRGEAGVEGKGEGDPRDEFRLAQFDGFRVRVVDQFHKLEVFGWSGRVVHELRKSKSGGVRESAGEETGFVQGRPFRAVEDAGPQEGAPGEDGGGGVGDGTWGD